MPDIHRIRTPGHSLPEIFKSVLEAAPEKPSHSVAKTKQIRTNDGEPVELTPTTISGRRGMSVKRLQAELRGDLDRIIMKAIEKEPEQRYQTVDQLTDDIHRYLVGKPVKALRKWVALSSGKIRHEEQMGRGNRNGVRVD